jgi:hypothetical protein
MPLLDFSTPTPTSKPGFWLYWAVTAPLTISVLAIYLTYLTRVEREEDKTARDNVPKNKDISRSAISEGTGASGGTLGISSILSKMLSYNPFKDSGHQTEPNPELGISSKEYRREDMSISEKGKSSEKKRNRNPIFIAMTVRHARHGAHLRRSARNIAYDPILGRARQIYIRRSAFQDNDQPPTLMAPGQLMTQRTLTEQALLPAPISNSIRLPTFITITTPIQVTDCDIQVRLDDPWEQERTSSGMAKSACGNRDEKGDHLVIAEWRRLNYYSIPLKKA